MDGLGAEGALIATRAIHFAATTITAGTLVFRTVIAAPVLRTEGGVADAFQAQTQRVLWASLLVTAISGAVWLLVQAASITGRPVGDTSVIMTILDDTQIGQVAQIRFALVIALALYLARARFAGGDWLALAAGLGLVASLAWTGHAGATAGQAGDLHVAADALHLCAAAAWIGGLLSLLLFFAAARRTRSPDRMSLVRKATERFSIMGMVSVAVLLATGLVNAWILVGSFHALIVTEYGQLLLLKLGVFAAMLALAAANRFWLTPRLGLSDLRALRWLARNSAIELALGLAVLAIVGLLGTLHPAIHSTVSSTFPERQTGAGAMGDRLTGTTSDHPLLVMDGRRTYLSWMTKADGYRFILIGDES
jgi:putative copper resistance protein D